MYKAKVQTNNKIIHNILDRAAKSPLITTANTSRIFAAQNQHGKFKHIL